MIDHIMLRVKDYAASKSFYDAVLETLGYRMVLEFPKIAGYGDDRKPYFWVSEAEDPHPRIHIAFMAKDHAAVDAFHAKALELGAKDDGAPGLRPNYHPAYYGAFVIDPDGHNIEAVCHTPARQLRASGKKAASKSRAKKKTPARTSSRSSAAKRAGSRKPAPRRKR